MKIFWIALPVLIVMNVYLASKPIHDFSATYDEPVHLTAGSVALKMKNFRYNGLHHPILGEAWAALPTLFFNPVVPVQHTAWLAQTWMPTEQYQFADLFLYHNRVGHEQLLSSARWMQVALSVMFLIGASLLILNAFGPIAALWFAMAWALSPTIFAHSTLVSTDLIFAGFFFLFFVAYASHQKTWLLGLLLGLCFASKYLAIAILPITLLLWWLDRRPWHQLAIVIGIAFIVIAMFYRGSLNVFFSGLSRIVGRSQAGRSSFFLGNYGSDGWVAYFPFAFFAKSTLVELAGFVLVLVMAARGKLVLPRALWVAPLLFFALACFSKVQIGHRHILAVYPFIFLMPGLAVQQLGHHFKWILPVALVGLLTEAVIATPNYLPYFNPLAGGSSNGYKLLTDSNNDWGQSLKQLSKELPPEDLEKGIFLSYFGTADPHAYGIHYLDTGTDPITNRPDDTMALGDRPTKFAISITNLQHTYYADKTVFAWLKDRTPWKVIGHTIFVYDFGNAPEDIKHLRIIRGGR